MKLTKFILTGLMIVLLPVVKTNAQQKDLPTPPQDKGLPYTRSAHATAVNALKNYTAIFAGSKYSYVNGYKVRLDNKDILRGDAVLKDGVIYIPESSACLIVSKTFQPKPIPTGLEILELIGGIIKQQDELRHVRRYYTRQAPKTKKYK